ncbi:ATP-dependent RecD-like DNA helicase [Leuconostoc gasicomitatum]|uniref:SF1B family DNA helicase RecD2 n=1 Tax=Leuconostoc gasicomitatum TaxID=115778 RepID=UPI000BDD7C7B|nr:ATP-dependent RecD-like DNA helicase [Leuconostoc gasicomitatum]MBZ5943717.1 ATP-dependent RecD-like DNA helicase [Leuconostoc gasicomitatum]MBZ5946737.1 ATP-dependent RecD-like DNA helicase [Leuconostoc gasicomitatum]MBZ5950005.1 ATP-dependent RecD-like DNA helicase [Leuconostoc gasicomitatum]MBZ5951632.1 ATP-dependent RecD-like DNA helicase [Leuconostoc gasicomitatum]MBZ5968603.1 ATP-dependent RecD-like DNA helicase [Leuconostoc gasicomitatum]
MAYQEQQLEKITGTLQNVIFASSDSYFKILSILIEESTLESWQEPEIIATGTFADVQEGSVYAFYGTVVRHPKYGQQLKVMRYENELPPDEEGLIKYFVSGQFSGIGQKTAEKIVDHLGLNAVNLILDDVHVLDGIIKEATAKKLVHSLQLNLGLERLFQVGNQFGIGADIAGRLYDQYGSEAQDILIQDPYRLVFEFDGISFKTADQIGQKSGIDHLDERRLQAAVYAAITTVSFQYGHTYLTRQQLLQSTAQLLRDEELKGALEQAITKLLATHILVTDNDKLYTTALYDAETQVGHDLKRLLQAKQPFEMSVADIDAAFITPGQLELDRTQIAAVKAGLNAQVFLLTGGPGTGKTTIVRSIVATWQKILQKRAKYSDQAQNFLKMYSVKMASPTGRAAKRMTEVTGYDATTIHRLLGIADLGEPEFTADNPISGGLLIIDEASMLDIELTAKLLAAVPNGMKLIIVGDSDQLPSVGPGNVLADLVASEKMTHVELDTIYRQGRGSSITKLAQHIKNGQLPEDFMQNQPDRSTFMVSHDQTDMAIKQVVQAAIKKGYTQDDLQILTPIYKTTAGVNALNTMAQELFNPIKPAQKSLQFGTTIFRKGDKILQLENDSERDVYNGDMGKIIAVQYKNDKSNDDHEDRLLVDFDGKELSYPKKNLNQLSLAYATTVHKAQGNEFKLVIVALTTRFGLMLNRNLLYTGITRAKEALILVGEYEAFSRAAQTAVAYRATFLTERLKDEVVIQQKNSHDKKTERAILKNILTFELIQSDTIEPLIGLNGITPYDFMPD